jgi:putative DNA primase/helicase
MSAETSPSGRYVELPIEQAREVYTREAIQKIADLAKWGKFREAWAYRTGAGRVLAVDAQIDGTAPDGTPETRIVTFWYNGKSLACRRPPISLFNLDLVRARPEAPILVVFGARAADKAVEIDPGIIPVTWSGGLRTAHFADWTELEDRQVWIYPDDDREVTKSGNPVPWQKQPSNVAALKIRKYLPEAEILKPHPAARRIREKGAGIVEALEAIGPLDLAEYLRTGPRRDISDKGEPAREPVDVSNIETPFRFLGTSDNGIAYVIGRESRLLEFSLTAITKTHLLNLAPIEWWRGIFGQRMQWDEAIDFVIGVVSKRDFDPATIRGRGAWREADGRICYHDGVETIGEPDPKNLYLRKQRRDIGITDPPAPPEITREIADLVARMSFENVADSIRILGWSALAPFAGALPWRPAGLITGASGSGKTTVLDLLVRPLAMPEAFSGGETTEAGVRQRIRNDAAAIVIEEAETDTQKKKWRREDLFSLMRQSTSDDTPKAAKGTRDGRGMWFDMRSMFLFAAISPEIEQVADDNRIFRVNMTQPRTEWKPIRDGLKSKLTPENCRSIRALTWNKIEDIIELADRMVPMIQDVTKKDNRFSLAEGMLFAAYALIWRQYEITDQALREMLEMIYRVQPVEGHRDETAEIVDRILDERVMIENPIRETVSIREILIAVMRGNFEASEDSDEYPAALTSKQISHIRNVAGRHGIGIVNDEIAIANNHHEIMRIINKGRGYQRVLWRHKNVIDRDRVIRLAGKARRCTVIGGLLEVEG